MIRTILLAVMSLSLISNAQAAGKKQVWVYTSVYKEFITPIEEAFEKSHPDIDIQVFQGGSEKLQAKLEAEFKSGKTQADIVLTSDPFWSQDLVKRDLAFTPKSGKPNEVNYYSLMILISHKDMPAASRPKSFQDLIKPEFKNLVQMGSPLESGTAFSTVAYLADKYSWDFFKKLRENNVASNGGNSTVIQKVESGEKKIGVVLLENALASKKRSSPIEIIYPTDGGILIPSVQVIMKGSPNLPETQKFAEFVLSKDGQNLLKDGFMYSVRSDVKAPEGALSFKDVSKTSKPWPDKFISDVSAKSRDIKKQFSEVVLN